jgi:hypothetical protein
LKDTFFAKVLKNQALDFKMLHKLVTENGKISIVSNHLTHVSGLDTDNRRVKAHNSEFNEKVIPSLTCPSKQDT